MKYDLSKPFKAEAAKLKFDSLLENKAYIELTEIKLKRNLDQNRLYWLWLGCIEKETERDRNELHLIFRAMFLNKDEESILKILNIDYYNQFKRIVSECRYFHDMKYIVDIVSYSTSELDVPGFAKYLKQIKSFARTNFGVILVNLEEASFVEFYKEYGFY